MPVLRQISPRLAIWRRSALLGVFIGSALAAIAGTPAEDAARKADAARVEATTARDVSRLRELLSEQLSYSQFEGNALTKAKYLEAVRASANHYEGYQYSQVSFLEIAPGVVTMTASASVKTTVGGKKSAVAFRLLAVWRQEDGAWKLLAYQSSRLPDVVPVTVP